MLYFGIVRPDERGLITNPLGLAAVRLTGSEMSRRRLGAEIAYAIYRACRPSGAKPEEGQLD